MLLEFQFCDEEHRKFSMPSENCETVVCVGRTWILSSQKAFIGFDVICQSFIFFYHVFALLKGLQTKSNSGSVFFSARGPEHACEPYSF